MSQVITKIEEVENVRLQQDSCSSYEGWRITTTEQTIELLIAEGQNCCENFGYATTNDNVADFIGAEVLNVTRTDKALCTKDLAVLEDGECECMFLTLETSKGPLQFVVYNSHKGYYGHMALIRSATLNENEVL